MLSDQAEFRAIVANFAPSARLLSAARLTGGVSADVFKLNLEHQGQAFAVVLRIHRTSHDGLDAKAEFDLLKAVRDAGIPVPQPLKVDVSGELIATPYLIMEFVRGRAATSIEDQSHIVTLMAQSLSQIHQARPETLPQLPDRIEPSPEVLEWLDESRWTELRLFLTTVTNRFNGARSLLHGDFWPENILWQEGEIAAILDWEDAAIGDPLSDVAGCCLELSYLYGAEVVQQFLDAYGVDTDFDMQRFMLWQIYVASAAAKYMGTWGLDSDREAHMRGVAHEMIERAAEALMNGTAS